MITVGGQPSLTYNTSKEFSEADSYGDRSHESTKNIFKVSFAKSLTIVRNIFRILLIMNFCLLSQVKFYTSPFELILTKRQYVFFELSFHVASGMILSYAEESSISLACFTNSNSLWWFPNQLGEATLNCECKSCARIYWHTKCNLRFTIWVHRANIEIKYQQEKYITRLITYMKKFLDYDYLRLAGNTATSR